MTTLDDDPGGTTRSAGGPAGRPAVTTASALIDPLTSRELQVLTLVAQGLRNRDIARTLVISEYTAANHVRSILMKTGSANRTQAARFATIHALIDQGEPPAVSAPRAYTTSVNDPSGNTRDETSTTTSAGSPAAPRGLG